MTFKEFRHSRFLSQSEAAMVLGVTCDWIRWKDPKKLTKYLATAVDDVLACGPHHVIKPRYFHADTTKPMLAAVRRRLPLGSCYLSLEYFEPGTLEIAQSRKDMLALAKNHPAERLFILRRLIARGKAGVQVIAVMVPHWPTPEI